MSHEEEARTEVVQEGSRIVIPEKMEPETAKKVVTRWANSQEEEVGVYEETEYHPFDGARALQIVAKELFGWSESLRETQVSIPIAHGKQDSILWGTFSFPGIDGRFSTRSVPSRTGAVFSLVGNVRKKHRARITELMNEVRGRFKELSIYRGKAMKMDFPETADDFSMDEHTPRFLDLSGVREEELVLPRATGDMVQACLFTSLEYSERARDLGIPMRRGILMEGPYGVGKTLTAYVAAKKAEENGWTFIYLEDPAKVPQALEFARLYSPSVIFAEDIDRVFDGSNRTPEVDAILNSIDGIDSKDTEVMVVLTTNNAKTINKAMMRPGRLDAVVSFRPPDAEAAIRLVQLYGRGLLAENINLEAVGQKLAGQIPAVIREVVERSKLYSIPLSPHGVILTADILESAADGMLHHLALMKDEEPDRRAMIERFGAEVGKEIGQALNGSALRH